MLKPAYKLTLGDRIIDTTDEPQASTATELAVMLDLDTPGDSLTLALGQVGGVKPEREDQALVELGYEDDPDSMTQVLAAEVTTVDQSLTTRRVIALGHISNLLRATANQTFEEKKAGEIVRTLAEAAGLTVATAEDGILFPGYVTDMRRSVYHHLHDLADLCGFDLYCNPEGELVFQRFTGGRIIHVFEYGTHIIRLDAVQGLPLAESVEIWGESPASARGNSAWAWLTKNFESSRGTAGSGEPKLLVEQSALRTTAAAGSNATATRARILRRRLRGRVLVLGWPDARLGDAIRLRGVPEDALNGVHQVRSVTHRITKRDGFTTEIGFRSIATD